MVTIIICYRAGTSEMLKVCLSSLQRHTKQEVACAVVTTDVDDGLVSLQKENQFSLFEVDVPDDPASRIHGNMLDKVIPSEITTEYVLTLDSDCFPVADYWLRDLLKMMDDSRLVGILHPWAPPPDDMAKSKMAWRIRSQRCWNGTHVACQMIRTADYKELQSCGVNYAGGDDTGLLVPMQAAAKGWGISGFRPTRCPLPSVNGSHFDPEYNRTCCVIFGDKMCHVGSYTLSKCGIEKRDSATFEWSVGRILADNGAEFLLEDRLSHRYRFGSEEEVSKYDMGIIFGVCADGRTLRRQDDKQGEWL
jgi:hypothetical protein